MKGSETTVHCRIGSFNMKNFGAYPKRDFQKIANIILGEQLDIVALQEILSAGKGIASLLEQCVKYQLYGWEFCWAAPHESQDPDKLREIIVNDNRGEGYAYIWNKRKFGLAEITHLSQKRIFEPRILNSMQSNDVRFDCSFARTPYYIRLYPCYGGFFELRLINIHIYFGDNTLSEIEKRQIEYDTLVQQIYPAISQKRYGENRPAFTIAMGDYNLNIKSTTPTQSNAYIHNTEYIYTGKRSSYHVNTIQEQLSTLRNPFRSDLDANSNFSGKGYANNYDHFTISTELSPFTSVTYGVIDAVHKYCDDNFDYYWENISDHLPIVIEVEI